MAAAPYQTIRGAAPPSGMKMAEALAEGVFGTSLNLCQNVAGTQSYNALDLHRTGLT